MRACVRACVIVCDRAEREREGVYCYSIGLMDYNLHDVFYKQYMNFTICHKVHADFFNFTVIDSDKCLSI